MTPLEIKIEAQGAQKVAIGINPPGPSGRIIECGQRIALVVVDMLTKRGDVGCLRSDEYGCPGVVVYPGWSDAAPPTTILLPQFKGWQAEMAWVDGYDLMVLLVRDGEQYPAAAQAGTTAES